MPSTASLLQIPDTTAFAIMEYEIGLPTRPTNLLTFLLGQPQSSSFYDGYNEEPTWFCPSQTFCVSAASPETRSYTFKQIKELVKSFASGLRKAGFRPGDRLMTMAPENVFLSLLILATIAAGGILVGRDPDHSAEQQAAIIKHCDPTFLPVYCGLEGVATEAIRKADAADIHQYCWDGKLLDPAIPSKGGDTSLPYWNMLLDREEGRAFEWKTFETETDAEATAMIIYISGTTGDPKGVELGHKGLIAGSTTYTHFSTPPANQPRWSHNFSTARAAGQ